MTVVILGMVGAGILVIRRWDTPLPLSSRGYGCILAAALLEGAVVRLLTGGEPGYSRLFLSVVAGSLLLAAVADKQLCQVHNFIWWPALAAAAAMLLCRPNQYSFRGVGESPGCLFLELAVFVLAQLWLFGRTYGRADCYAFCICSIALAARGIGLMGMLLQMIAAYGMLIPIQMLRRNVRRARLKRPVPFLPYIVIAFWLLLAAQRLLPPVKNLLG